MLHYKHKVLENLNWQEVDQLAIYTAEELNSGQSRTIPVSSRVDGLSPGPPDYKSSTLITWAHHIHLVMLFPHNISGDDHTFSLPIQWLYTTSQNTITLTSVSGNNCPNCSKQLWPLIGHLPKTCNTGSRRVLFTDTKWTINFFRFWEFLLEMECFFQGGLLKL